ncbi:hypothetical protein NE237_031483 [Protea cynaroides]|uniref:Uncharacterized protein n=1 Tax=Protea cynaroides TaxID=273540 RepID=A0A9Q0L2J3_9MAGN|nr:hypothetical protein NE237_031483 [Protea cynaroides]
MGFVDPMDNYEGSMKAATGVGRWGEDDLRALVLNSTIFHLQGAGQPSDSGFITHTASNFKFSLQDDRLKDGPVHAFESWETKGFRGSYLFIHDETKQREKAVPGIKVSPWTYHFDILKIYRYFIKPKNIQQTSFFIILLVWGKL